MEQPGRETNLSPEEQELEARLMRAGNPAVRKESGKVSEEFWKLPKPEDPERLALRYLPEDRRQSR